MSDETKMKDSANRVLVLEPIPGMEIKSSTGLVDNRLFKGGNKLHAISDEEHHNLWYLKYESGGLPEPLKQQFTSFSNLMRFVTPYFEQRGLRIKKVED